MDDKMFDELLASLKEADTIIKLLRVARAAKVAHDTYLLALKGELLAWEQLAEALKEVEDLL